MLAIYIYSLFLKTVFYSFTYKLIHKESFILSIAWNCFLFYDFALQILNLAQYSDFMQGQLGLTRVGWFPWSVQLVKNLPAMQEALVWFLGWKDPLEKGYATHSSILAWRIPWSYSPWGCKESDMTEWLSLSPKGKGLKGTKDEFCTSQV